MDINTKALKKNAFRVTKERGVTASRIRVPGGHLDAKYLSQIQHIAETFGNGTVHITSRQGFEIPGIPFEKMPEVNAALQNLIVPPRRLRLKRGFAARILRRSSHRRTCGFRSAHCGIGRAACRRRSRPARRSSCRRRR